MIIIDLIKKDDVKELSAYIFEQSLKTSKTDKGSYTEPLSEDEELLAVERFTAKPALWYEFLKRYTMHYPLFNSATAMLIENLSCTEAQQLVKNNFTKYGCNADQVRLIYQQNCDMSVKTELFRVICVNARIFDKEIYQILEKYDDAFNGELHFAETYKKNAFAYFH